MTSPTPVLDHVVIDARDRIGEAEQCFTSLGFLLTPRGRHSLGSVNHLAMFTTNYLELLGFGEHGPARPELVPFPVGLNGLVFNTTDADLVHRQAAAAGLPVLPVQSFSRPLTIDGATHDARFRTTRLDPSKIAMGRVYFCEHQTPGLVWRREWQTHPNGAHAIARVVVTTGDPHQTAVLFRDLFGGDAVAEGDGRHVIAAGTTRIELVAPDGVAEEFGEAAAEPAGRAEHMAVLGIKVRSLPAAAQQLRSIQGLHAEPHRLIVPAGAAFNTTIVFSE